MQANLLVQCLRSLRARALLLFCHGGGKAGRRCAPDRELVCTSEPG